MYNIIYIQYDGVMVFGGVCQGVVLNQVCSFTLQSDNVRRSADLETKCDSLLTCVFLEYFPSFQKQNKKKILPGHCMTFCPCAKLN